MGTSALEAEWTCALLHPDPQGFHSQVHTWQKACDGSLEDTHTHIRIFIGTVFTIVKNSPRVQQERKAYSGFSHRDGNGQVKTIPTSINEARECNTEQ